jgi:hypothetical protein
MVTFSYGDWWANSFYCFYIIYSQSFLNKNLYRVGMEVYNNPIQSVKLFIPRNMIMKAILALVVMAAVTLGVVSVAAHAYAKYDIDQKQAQASQWKANHKPIASLLAAE